jgi:hypothetical protein
MKKNRDFRLFYKTTKFFKIAQNKIHFVAHRQTSSEVLYFKVDSNKSFIKEKSEKVYGE